MVLLGCLPTDRRAAVAPRCVGFSSLTNLMPAAGWLKSAMLRVATIEQWRCCEESVESGL